jgi:hypothetical protein
VPGAGEHLPPMPGEQSASAGPAVEIPAKYANKDTSDLNYEIHKGQNTIDIELK